MHFKLYQDKSGQWRWTLHANNHEPIADSAEGYINKSEAQHGIALVKSAGVGTPVTE